MSLYNGVLLFGHLLSVVKLLDSILLAFQFFLCLCDLSAMCLEHVLSITGLSHLVFFIYGMYCHLKLHVWGIFLTSAQKILQRNLLHCIMLLSPMAVGIVFPVARMSYHLFFVCELNLARESLRKGYLSF